MATGERSIRLSHTPPHKQVKTHAHTSRKMNTHAHASHAVHTPDAGGHLRREGDGHLFAQHQALGQLVRHTQPVAHEHDRRGEEADELRLRRSGQGKRRFVGVVLGGEFVSWDE